MSKVTFASDHPDVWAMYPTLKGHLAFDIGANGGMVTEMLAPNFDHVVAFEPCKESADELRALHLENVTVNEVAVTTSNGTIWLEEMDRSTAGMGELVTASAETELSKFWGTKTGDREVPAVRLDTCFDLYGRPDFIKIDTEGHEREVVESGEQKLNVWHPRMIIEIHRADYGEAIRNLLSTYSWDTYLHPIYQKRHSSLLNQHYWMVSR